MMSNTIHLKSKTTNKLRVYEKLKIENIYNQILKFIFIISVERKIRMLHETRPRTGYHPLLF